MYLVLGVTGHVGKVVAEQLLGRGEQVAVIVRDEHKGVFWSNQGAQVILADVNDVDSLRRTFAAGQKLFMMLPPGDVAGDALQEEYGLLENYHAALVNSGVQKIVGLSSYGAQLEGDSGNLLSSRRMETFFEDLPLKKSFVRPAYYFSNWEMSLQTARDEGVVHTFYPPELKFPMVAPQDNGEFNAKVMLEPLESEGIYQVEGPEHYSSSDVADAFAAALGKKVEAVEIKPDDWKTALSKMGFSEASAEEFIAMTRTVVDGKTGAEAGKSVHRGQVTLQQYIAELVHSAKSLVCPI